MPTTSISARIDSTLAENIKIECGLRGISQRVLIEAAIKAYLRPIGPTAPTGDDWQQWRRTVDERLDIALEKLIELAPPKTRRKIKGSGQGFH